MNSKEAHIQLLVAKKLSGEISLNESDELNELVSHDSEAHRIYESSKRIWEGVSSEQSDFQLDVNDAWQKVIQGIENENVRVVKFVAWKSTLKIAAAISFILVASYLLLTLPFTERIESYATESDSLTINLKDGSVVFLKPHSELTVSNSFGAGTREVGLTGEAFFKVERDSIRPFAIETKLGKVLVLGTSFLVEAFEDTETMTVSVATGKVLLSSNKTEETKELQRGQIAFVSGTGLISDIKAGDLNQFASQTGILEFKDSPLSDVFNSLELYFLKPILAEDNSVYQCRFTGYFEQPSMQEMLQVIHISLGLDYRIEFDSVVIVGTGCN